MSLDYIFQAINDAEIEAALRPKLESIINKTREPLTAYEVAEFQRFEKYLAEDENNAFNKWYRETLLKETK